MSVSPLNLYSSYLKKQYGSRVQKIPVDAGFTCPNRDGSKGLGGCTFCNNEAFSTGDKVLSISQQVQKGIQFYQRRYPGLDKFIVYFQSYSNTYKPTSELEKLYRMALDVPGVVGLAIGTRPDCIDADKVSLLRDLARNYEVTVEYGIESFHEETLLKINRGHSVKDFARAIELTEGKGIRLCTHLILGFPWEDESHFAETLRQVGKWPLDFIKVHQLQVVKGTAMGHSYLQQPFKILSKTEYFDLLKRLITHLPPQLVIQRLFSQYTEEHLLSPSWSMSLSQLMTEFIQLLQKESLYQGKALLLQET